MKKNKKELTSIQLQSSFKHRKWACFIGKWLSIVSPFIIIGAVNFNEYFTEVNGVRMSFGCVLALVVMGFSIYSQTKGKENTKLNTVIKWGIAWGLVYFFSSILNDLVMIVGAGFAGQVVGAGFDTAYNIYDEKEEILKKANFEALARKSTNV